MRWNIMLDPFDDYCLLWNTLGSDIHASPVTPAVKVIFNFLLKNYLITFTTMILFIIIFFILKRALYFSFKIFYDCEYVTFFMHTYHDDYEMKCYCFPTINYNI